MNRILLSAGLLFALLHPSCPTRVNQCKPLTGEITDESIQISACQEPPCRLRKKTEASIQLKFTPESDISSLKTRVHAIIVGVEFPFIGVDGGDACKDLYLSDGKTKASCPLKAGQTYTYKNSFKILEVYPKIKVLIHWALQDSRTKKDAACFELDARITS